MTEQRRFAAIVSADVAGYSRLMGAARWHRNAMLEIERSPLRQSVNIIS